ncbi:MAG: hypothetical protein WCA79_11125 [Anaerolineales bacterium]
MNNSKPSNTAVLFRTSITSSVLVGLSIGYSAYVLFLQTPVVSWSRLAIGCILLIVFAILNYLFAYYYLKERLATAFARRPYLLSLCLFLPLLFLPLFYIAPAYPVSPLLQPWTDVAVEFDVNPKSQAISFSKSDVRLNLNGNALDAESFIPVGIWKSTQNTFSLDPGSSASLRWTDPAPELMTLIIHFPPAIGTLTVYWDESRTTFELSPDSATQIVLIRRLTTPPAISVLLFLAFYILSAWILFLLLTLFSEKIRFSNWLERAMDSRSLILLLALILAIVTVKLQLESLRGGMSFLYSGQLQEHNNVLAGQAPNPWQYRVLSEIVAEGFIDLFRFLRVQDPIGFGFVSFRVLQNLAVFLLAFALYHQTSTSKLLPFMGVVLLACTIKNGFYDNDLSFNTYFDVIFYLAAVLLILRRHYFWVALLMLPAALNRETSGVIPFLMLAAVLDNLRFLQKKYVPVYLAMAIYALMFIGLRFLYPNRPIYIPYKQTPGYQLLLYNLTRAFTWDQLFHTLAFAPLLGLVFFFVLPNLWQRFFLVLCPIWFGIHAFLSVMGETRLFFVPQAIIFIPAVLFVLEYFRGLELAKNKLHVKGT